MELIGTGKQLGRSLSRDIEYTRMRLPASLPVGIRLIREESVL
jgi:hypothetical protein